MLGAVTREGLVLWSVAGTVLLFLLGWLVGLATGYANIGFGQRMVYDLASDLFTHLQRLSLRFHSRKSVGRLHSPRDDRLRLRLDDRARTRCCPFSAPLVMPGRDVRRDVADRRRADAGRARRRAVHDAGARAATAKPMLESAATRSRRPRDSSTTSSSGRFRRSPSCRRSRARRRPSAISAATTNGLVGGALALGGRRAAVQGADGLGDGGGTAAILWIGGTHALDGQLTVGSILVFPGVSHVALRTARVADVHAVDHPERGGQRAARAGGARDRARSRLIDRAPADGQRHRATCASST